MKTIAKIGALLVGGGAILLVGCGTPYCGPTGCYYPTNTTYYGHPYYYSNGCSYRYCTTRCYSNYCPNKCCLNKYRYYNSYLDADDRDVYYNGY